MTASVVTESAIAKLHAALARADEDEEVKEIIAARDKVLARYQAVFSPDHLPQLTEEEFKGFLLFENNQHWTGLARKGYSLCDDMPRLREALTILLDESQPIRERLDRLIPKAAPRFMPKLGKARHHGHPARHTPRQVRRLQRHFRSGDGGGRRFAVVRPRCVVRRPIPGGEQDPARVGIRTGNRPLDAGLALVADEAQACQAEQRRKAGVPGCIPTKRLALFKAVNVRRNVKRFMEGEGKDKGRNPGRAVRLLRLLLQLLPVVLRAEPCRRHLLPREHPQSCLQLAFYLASWGMLRGIVPS